MSWLQDKASKKIISLNCHLAYLFEVLIKLSKGIIDKGQFMLSAHLYQMSNFSHACFEFWAIYRTDVTVFDFSLLLHHKKIPMSFCCQLHLFNRTVYLFAFNIA